MLRGHEDELDARDIYSDQIAGVNQVGFITNESWGFKIGFSPDGLVGSDGIIEVKSRRQKFQTETILSNEVPREYLIQIQTGLLVSGRKWCDFISYCGGMPMFVKRVHADKTIQQAILICATEFEKNIREQYDKYMATMKTKDAILIPTERREVLEEIVI
jgi:predicted phage-related endonuclease